MLTVNEKKDRFLSIFTAGSHAFPWLVLAAFSVQISFVFESMILFLIKKPLPVLIAPVLSAVSFVLFYICLRVYFSKATPLVDKKASNVSNIIASVVGAAVLLFVMLLISLSYRQLIALLPLVAAGNAASLAYLFVFLVAAALSVTLIFLSLVYLTGILLYKVSISDMWKLFVKTAEASLKKLHKLIAYSGLLVALLYVSNILLNLVSEILTRSFAGGFLMIYLRYFCGAAANGYVFLIIINLSMRLLPQNDTAGTNQENISQKAKFNLPVFPAAIIVLTVLLLFILSPVRQNKADLIISEIKSNMALGDTYGELGLSQRSIYEYDTAYSKLLSLKGYLLSLDYQMTKKGDTLAKADEAMRTADGLSGKNSYLPYFRARMMSLSNNTDGAISQYKKTLLYTDTVNEAYFGLLKAYKDKGDNSKVKEILTVLITGEIFYDNITKIEKFSENALEKYLDRLQELDDELAPKMVYKYVEKTKYNDMASAQEGLMALHQKFPQNAVINYFIAKVANQYKNETSQYPTVTKFTKEFEKLVDTSGGEEDEVATALFSAQMYMGAGDFITAEDRLSQIYSKYPQRVDVAEQYVYILNKNKKYDNSLSVLQESAASNKEAYSLDYLSAMAYLGKADAENSLKSFVKFHDTAAANTELIPYLDKYLYSYCLAFAPLLQNKDVAAKLENIKGNELLYNYILAIKGWRDKNSAASLESIAKVLKINDKLGYAYYIQGINYYEDTVRNNKTDFSKAEEYYLKSLQIIPQHAEGYFALAHCYKKWGKNLEALRAFRKAADLMPFEDHRLDPYGITVHAIGEINSLAQYEK